MSNLDPHAYKNGQPIAALEVGEETTSANPKIELGKSKAILATVGGVATALSVWLTSGVLADGALDLNESIAGVIALLGGLGFGVGTYVIPTKVSGK